MPMQRHILPWNRPALASAVDWLLEQQTDGNLTSFIVVLPSRRGGRRLEELLLDEADARGIHIAMPQVMTVGRLPDLLVDDTATRAGDFARQVAWIQALREADPAQLTALLPRVPDAGDITGWASLARLLESLHLEVAGEALQPADVARQGAQLPDFTESDRWLTIDNLYESYLARLAAMGLADPQAQRLEAVRRADPPAVAERIVLIGAADLNRLQRAAVDRLADRITLLMHVPPDADEAFDEYGCVVPEAWEDVAIPLDDEAITIVDRPGDQAGAVVNWLANHAGQFGADEITIGLCDDQIAPYLEQRLTAHGVPVRYAAGTPLTRTGPYRLLAAIADLLESRRFSDLAALVRHPDLTHWMLENGGGDGPLPPEAIDRWLSLMDRYYSEHLQARLTARWLGDDRIREPMKRLYDALFSPTMLGGMRGTRPLPEWAQRIVQILINVYAVRPLDRTEPAGRLTLEACLALHAVIQQLHDLPEAGAEVVSAGHALRLVLNQVATASVPPAADDAAVELVGPLELPLDDAAAVVITGVNEGAWPESINAHPFLPNTLRAHLGLMDNRRRYARDAYVLRCVLSQDRPVHLIGGRRDADGNPLMPSRLLMADETDVLASRIRRFGDESDLPAARPRLPLEPGAVTRFARPEPRKLDKPFEYLRVTDFRLYLHCPYRFYLSRALGLACEADGHMEMDGLRFGSLAHDVLDLFGRSDVKTSTDPKQIRGFLHETLETLALGRFGDELLPAVRVQLEQLHARLAAFAFVQARRVRQGWIIQHVEEAFEGQRAWIEVDGEPMYLRGRIDRIEYNADTDRWALLDYKTTANGGTPESTHRSGRGSNKRWVDLQLPLYRHLARWLEQDGRRVLDDEALNNLELGYVLLPARVEDVDVAVAEWSAADLADADETARDVVRRIRGEEFAFDPNVKVRSDYDDFAVICGTGQRFGDNGSGNP